ncbi:MAG: F0F1 ATP synthase subunit epsilon [Rhizobiales bacterium]|nr:F0F1 ATP synthase subunit epsilon [Hyphomicrobiales bacterium]
MARTFKFELVSPERLLLSANATEAVVPGAEGLFMVLPLHAPMLSTLRAGVIDVKTEDGGERRFFVRSGLAEVSGDSLTILAQRSVDLDAIDKGWLAQEIKNAEEDLADADSDDKRGAAQHALERLKAIEASL